eukprot:PITA_32494
MEATQSVDQRSLHAVLFPFPLQGHIKPFMNLAHVLSTREFYITFVLTEFVQKRLAESGVILTHDDDSIMGNRNHMNIRFEALPDGLPPRNGSTLNQNVPVLFQSMTANAHFHFHKLMERLRHLPNVPPVTFIVSDGLLSKTQDVANEYGIPRVAFWSTSAFGFTAYFSIPLLIDKGYLPLKDESCLTEEYLDEVRITCIPGMPPLRLRELPNFLLVTDISDPGFQSGIMVGQGTLSAAALLVNTFEELERPVLEALSVNFRVYAIGPLLLSQSFHCKSKDGPSDELSMWHEESCCLTWLDTQNPCSVVYVCLGSIAVLSNEQLLEFAWGLASSNQHFLWVIRPDIVNGESAILPTEFIEETKDRGLLLGWAPQIKVLSHPSVGGFLTHSGWNSTLESISGGVPMICWPFLADQHINARFICEEWGIGMHLKKPVKMEEVAVLVSNLIGGEEGVKMRERVGKLKQAAMRAVQDGGSSNNNLEKLLHQIIPQKNASNYSPDG